MKRATLFTVIVLLLFSITLGACGGGGAKVKNQITTTSLGQELTDLNLAHSQGIITDKEHKKAKKGLIKRYK